MPTRSRTMLAYQQQGTNIRFVDNVNVGQSTDTFTLTNTCVDVTGNREGENPLDLTRYEVLLPPVLNGDTRSGATDPNYYQLSNWPLSPNLEHLSVSGLPSNLNCAAMVLSRTNPSRPVVDVPILFAEVRELPALFRIAGRTLLRRGAGAYLSYQFGWKPLISDMMKLLDFSAHVRRRSLELSRIFEGGGTKASVSCGSASSQQYVPNLAMFSLDGILRYNITKRTVVNKWATARWEPDATAVARLPKGSAEMERLARRAVLGLTLDASTAWELIPFSWMIDYFTSIGDYLSAHRNMMPVKPTMPCVMTSTATFITADPVPLPTRPYLEAKPIMLKRTRKQRAPTALSSPVADLTFLSNTQVSILGALAITRIPRRLLR